MRPARVAPEPLAVLLRQLAGAARAGVPAGDALAIIAKDTDLGKAPAALIAGLAGEIAAGKPLSAALQAHPGAFPPEAARLVLAGEQSNALPQALELLARDQELRVTQRSGTRGALAWPILVIGFLVLIVAFLMIFIVPAFKGAYSAFGADLPAPTLLIMGVSDAFVAYWWIIVPLIVAAVWFGGARFSRIRWANRVLLLIPVLRSYLVKTFVARLAQVLAVSVTGGLPPAFAVSYLRATTGNVVLRDITDAIERRLGEGGDLVAAVIAAPRIPRRVAVALELGARSRNLDTVLAQLVEASDEDAARSLVELQQAALVAVYALLGVLVGIVVIGMYLPIFKLGAVI
jgi:type IV pilus assembly protein PilC